MDHELWYLWSAFSRSWPVKSIELLIFDACYTKECVIISWEAPFERTKFNPSLILVLLHSFKCVKIWLIETASIYTNTALLPRWEWESKIKAWLNLTWKTSVETRNLRQSRPIFAPCSVSSRSNLREFSTNWMFVHGLNDRVIDEPQKRRQTVQCTLSPDSWKLCICAVPSFKCLPH